MGVRDVTNAHSQHIHKTYMPRHTMGSMWKVVHKVGFDMVFDMADFSKVKPLSLRPSQKSQKFYFV